jgi:organic radical activating enzyme
MPFNSIQIHPSGNFKICCFSGSEKGEHGIVTDEADTVMNIMTHDIKDALNSKLHKELRLAQSENKRHTVCEVCWKKDDASVQSYRTGRTYFFNKNDYNTATTVDSAASKMKLDGSIDPNLLSLDIRFGNLCNAKCIHCTPMYSNAWYEDHIRLYGKIKYPVGNEEYEIYMKNGVLKSTMSDSKWWETARWWQQFDTIKENLRTIYVTGGEPFLVPAHDIMLDKLIQDGLCKNIDLEYDSNFSVINPKILSKLSKFRSVTIAASFEDIEDRFELIRFPLKFNRVVNNLKMVKDYGVEVSAISSCLGIYTAFAPSRLVPYFQDLGFTDFRFRLLRNPAVYDLQWLPKKQKEIILNSYEKTNLGNKNTKALTGYLNNTLNKSSEPMTRQFVGHMNSLDKIRGTNWKQTMPDVAELVKDFI